MRQSSRGAKRRRRVKMCFKMFTLKQQTNLLLVSLSLIILASSIEVDAQFFTKSSKSIPRMGRRSDSSMAANQYKHQLIDSLIDEYGPQFVAALEGKGSMGQDEGSKIPGTGGGEVVYRNDQPFDLTVVSPDARLDSSTGYELVERSRDERSPNQRPSNFKGSSLAMRALNLNRLMQHLASGGQPILPYDKLFNGGRQQSYRNSNSIGEQLAD